MAIANIDPTKQLSPSDTAAVLELARVATTADGVAPISEQVLLHLRHHCATDAVHLVVRDGSDLVGYAQVDLSDEVSGPTAEVCVHPLHRRRGHGRALVRAALSAAARDAGSPRLRLWAHGDHPSAAALAWSLGFTRSRTLWQLRRRLAADLPEPAWPDEIGLRTFAPGRDDDAWLRLNSRAFADHPEQGRWTLADLRIRQAEPWFDPTGFLLAYRRDSGELTGFHWTKIHSGADGVHRGHSDIGEVYVLGVDPATGIAGLGTALTLAGLAHLHDRGQTQVMLYVDDSNHRAVRLYQRLGFAHWATDVLFEHVRADPE